MQSKTYIQTFDKININSIKEELPINLYRNFGSLEDHINSRKTFKDKLSSKKTLKLVTGEIMGQLLSRFPPRHKVWGNTRIQEGIIYFPKKNPVLVRNSSAYSIEASKAHERHEQFYTDDFDLSNSLTIPRITHCIELIHTDINNPESDTFKIYNFIFGKYALDVAKKRFRVFKTMRFFMDHPAYVDTQDRPYAHLISLKDKMNNLTISASGRDLDDPNYGFVYNKL